MTVNEFILELVSILVWPISQHPERFMHHERRQ